MVELGLFECNDNRITCLKMAYRLDDTSSRHPEIRRMLEQLKAQEEGGRQANLPGIGDFPSENSESTSENSESTSENPEDSSGVVGNPRPDKTRLDKKDICVDSQNESTHNPARMTKADHLMVIGLYEEILPELSSVMVSRWHGSAHAKQLAARWKEDERFRTPEFWRAFFGTVRQNTWWLGIPDERTGAFFDKCNLAWLVKRINFDKVLDFAADQSKRQAQQGGASR